MVEIKLHVNDRDDTVPPEKLWALRWFRRHYMSTTLWVWSPFATNALGQLELFPQQEGVEFMQSCAAGINATFEAQTGGYFILRFENHYDYLQAMLMEDYG